MTDEARALADQITEIALTRLGDDIDSGRVVLQLADVESIESEAKDDAR